jgi:regulator of RNase E activity RraB
MTDDTDDDRQSNRTVTGTNTTASESTHWSRDRWESLKSNPDDGGDLGYEITEWEQFETLDGTDQVIFLPNSESQLKDAAFIVTGESALLDLENHC